MSGFLYFVPKFSRQVTLKDIKTWCLGYAFESAVRGGICQNNTPTKTQGTIFADPGRHDEGRIKMDMDAQVWRKMPRPGQEDVYIGYWKDSPPGPDDLKRANQLGGYQLKLADGKQWLIPVVRLFDEAAGELRSNLPSYIDVDDNGNPKPGQVVPLYAHLEDLTAPFAEAMISSPDTNFEDVDIYRAARVLLQVNYVVDMIEIAQAKVLTDEQMAHSIIAAAIDWPSYLRWQKVSKKKEPSLVTASG